MRTSFEHAGRRVTVTKDGRRWYVEVGGALVRSRYLDEALEAAFPELAERERVLLQLKLLQWLYELAQELPLADGAPDGEAAGEGTWSGWPTQGSFGWPMPSPRSAFPSPLSVWPMPGLA